MVTVISTFCSANNVVAAATVASAGAGAAIAKRFGLFTAEKSNNDNVNQTPSNSLQNV